MGCVTGAYDPSARCAGTSPSYDDGEEDYACFTPAAASALALASAMR